MSDFIRRRGTKAGIARREEARRKRSKHRAGALAKVLQEKLEDRKDK